MNINALFEFFIFLAGAYFASLFVKLKTNGEIPKSLVSPRNTTGTVRDLEGYTKYIYVKGLIGSIMLSLSSLLLLACDVYDISGWFDTAAGVINAGSIIFLCVVCLKGQKKYLDKKEF